MQIDRLSYAHMNTDISVGKISGYQPADSRESGRTQKNMEERDILQISKEGYAMQKHQKLSASSGKDELGISMGDKEGEYIIYFSDSAMVNRTVSRGYLTVNGKKLELSDDQKEALSLADKQAEKNCSISTVCNGA